MYNCVYLRNLVPELYWSHHFNSQYKKLKMRFIASLQIIMINKRRLVFLYGNGIPVRFNSECFVLL